MDLSPPWGKGQVTHRQAAGEWGRVAKSSQEWTRPSPSCGHAWATGTPFLENWWEQFHVEFYVRGLCPRDEEVALGEPVWAPARGAVATLSDVAEKSPYPARAGGG